MTAKSRRPQGDAQLAEGIQSPALPDQYCGVLYDNNRYTEVVSTAAGYLYSVPEAAAE